MSIFEVTPNSLKALERTDFASQGLRERTDLQPLIRKRIDVLAPNLDDPNLLVIGEEFNDWEDSQRRIDLLAVDKNAKLVVIELKRTESGGHMELQALRYAAMVSTMTFVKAVKCYRDFLQKIGSDDDPESNLLEFLGWEEPDEERFAQDVRVILASADFSKELTTAVMWLNQRDLDIRCIRLQPYSDGERVFLDVQQVIPLPEAKEFQSQLKEKAQRERQTRIAGPDTTRYDVAVLRQEHKNLPKRRALLQVIQALLQADDSSPQKIASKVPGISYESMFISVEGNFNNQQEFIESAERQGVESGRGFNPGYWFAGSDELLHSDGRTYALRANVWHKEIWIGAMRALQTHFPQANIQFRPADKIKP